jgi:hypothetical protein
MFENEKVDEQGVKRLAKCSPNDEHICSTTQSQQVLFVKETTLELKRWEF